MPPVAKHQERHLRGKERQTQTHVQSSLAEATCGTGSTHWCEPSTHIAAMHTASGTALILWGSPLSRTPGGTNMQQRADVQRRSVHRYYITVVCAVHVDTSMQEDKHASTHASKHACMHASTLTSGLLREPSPASYGWSPQMCTAELTSHVMCLCSSTGQQYKGHSRVSASKDLPAADHPCSIGCLMHPAPCHLPPRLMHCCGLAVLAVIHCDRGKS